MKVVVFTGGTLPPLDAAQLLAAIYLPPLRKADLTSAICSHNPDIVAVIDGCPSATGGVWHSELIHAMERGIKVYGGAALGALRASELQAQGMIGVGQVYQWFADGHLSADDEVLCRYGSPEQGYPRLTLSMVGIRAHFAAAQQHGVISGKESKLLLSCVKQIYWPQRTWPKLLLKMQQVIAPQQLQDLLDFIAEHPVDLQRRDAELLLRRIAEDTRGMEGSHTVRYTQPKNILQALYSRDRKVCHQETELPLVRIAQHTALNHPQAEELARQSMNRGLVGFLAELLEVEVSAAEVDDEEKRFRRKHQLPTEQQLVDWMNSNKICREEFDQLLNDQARCHKLRQWYLGRLKLRKNTQLFLDELRLNGEYVEWADKSVHQEQRLRGKEQTLTELMESNDFKTILQQRLTRSPLPWHGPLIESAQQHGFTSATLFHELAREQVVDDSLRSLVESLFS